MTSEKLLNAEWTDDCCGKKDYDGAILLISTRYWPKGGSTLALDAGTPEGLARGLVALDDGSPCSAHSSLEIRYAGEEGEEVLAESGYIQGAGFEEVAHKVEAWAQVQMDRAVAALRIAFQETPPGQADAQG